MPKRSNQEWLEELRGDRGRTWQTQAHQDLSGYLYKVAYNYLKRRQAEVNPYILANLAPQELVALAKDFVQETLEKLARNNFALLDQFKGKGRFTSWAAVIVRRQAAQELRKSYWDRRVSLPQETWTQNGHHDDLLSPFEQTPDWEQVSPESFAMQQQAGKALQECLGGLKESHRQALWGFVVEERSGEELARTLDRSSSNAIYTLVGRTRRKLRKCLEKKGWNQDVIEIFAESHSEIQTRRDRKSKSSASLHIEDK